MDKEEALKIISYYFLTENCILVSLLVLVSGAIFTTIYLLDLLLEGNFHMIDLFLFLPIIPFLLHLIWATNKKYTDIIYSE